MIPDITKALVAAIKADSRIIAAQVQGKVSTKLPDNFTGEKRIQLFRVDSAPVDARTEAAHRPVIQVNAFGHTEDESNEMASLIHDVMRSFEGTMISGIWIGGVDTITGPSWSPDPETSIPRNIMRFGMLTRKRSS